MKLIYPIVAAVLLAGSAFTFITAQSWKIADNFDIKFATTGDAAGIFKGLKGAIVFDAANLAASKIDVSVDATTANTGNGLMNTHLKGAEYLDVKKFPLIQFSSQKIVRSGGGFQVTGILDMHGVKKPITFPFTFVQTAAGGTFHGTFAVNRLDFKVGKPGDVDENINLDITVPVTK